MTIMMITGQTDSNDINKSQSNLAKGDIARLIMTYEKEILSMLSSIIFAKWKHMSQS